MATVSGDSVKNRITRTLPNGSIQTTDETAVIKGTKTTLSGTATLPGGGTLSITGDTVNRGSQSITDKTITGPTGQIYHDHIVTTDNGTHGETKTNTAVGPGGTTMTVTSVTTTVLNSTAVAQSAAEAGINIPATGLGAQKLKLEAQVIAPSSTGGDTGGTVLPAAAPEPGSLVVFSVVLGAAAICRGLSCRRAASGPKATPYSRRSQRHRPA